MAKLTKRAWALTNTDGKVASLRHIYPTREAAREALRSIRHSTVARKYGTVAPVTISTTGKASVWMLTGLGGVPEVRYGFKTRKQANTVRDTVLERDGIWLGRPIKVSVRA